MTDVNRILAKLQFGYSQGRPFWQSVAGVLGWPLVSTPLETYNITHDQNVLLLVETRAPGGHTVVMPPLPWAGQRILIKDGAGNAESSPISISFKYHGFEGTNAPTTVTLDEAWSLAVLIYTGTQWVSMGGGGGGISGGGGGGTGTDENAIHDNVAGEIAAILAKATPVDTDLLIIEDSEDSFAKKAVAIGALGVTGTDERVKVSANDTTAGDLEAKIVAGTGISITTLNDGGDEDLQISSTVVNTDELAKVSANDTTTGYLAQKIVAGAGITINELNDGGDEDLQIVADAQADPTVSVTANDTTPDYLLNKLAAGTNVTITELNDGANEDAQISAADPTVKVSVDDTTAGDLEAKIVAGTGISITTLNPGADEDLQISSTVVNTDESAKVSANDTTAGYLAQKIIAGPRITIAELNDGGDEDLQITASVQTDPTVKVTSNDTTANYLLNKFAPSTNFAILEVNDGADESIQLELIGTKDGFDGTAIHNNVASEISAIAAKVTPTVADFLLIEDAADFNSKKRITVGDLPTAGGGVAGPVSSTDNAIVRWDGATGDTIQNSGIYISDSDQLTSVQEIVFEEPYETVVASAAENIDWANGTLQRIYLDRDVTLTFSAPSEPPAGALFRGALLTLRVVQSNGGGWGITWPGTVSGTAPTLNTATGEANSTVVQFLFDGTTGFPAYFFLSKGAVVDRWWGPWGLSYDMWNNQSLRYGYRADDFLSARLAEDQVVIEDYPLTGADSIQSAIDVSARQQDATAPPFSTTLDWDATAGKEGPLLEATAGVGTKNNGLEWPASKFATAPFNFIHEDGLFTIIMRVVFHSNPNTETHYLLTNNGRDTTAGEKHGTTDGTNGPFVFNTTYTTVRKGTVTVHYFKPGSSAATLTDDGAGNLSGTNASGTINYDTGAVSFTSTDGTTSGTDIAIDYQMSRGFELAADGLGGGISFTVDAGWSALCQVATTPSLSTTIEHDIAVVCDTTTLSLYYGDQATADDTATFVGKTGDALSALWLGARTGALSSVPADWLGDFTLRGLVILNKAASQAEREQWLNWIGGTDYSDANPLADVVFNYQPVRGLSHDYYDLNLPTAGLPVRFEPEVNGGLSLAGSPADTLPAFWDEVWEVDDITGSPVQGDLIQTWNAGVGVNNLTQATSGLRPTYYVGRWSREVDMLYFNNDYMDNSSVGVYTQNNVISCVFQLQDTSSTQVLWDSDTASARNHAYRLGGLWYAYAGSSYSTTSPADDLEWRTLTEEYSNTTSWIRQDGVRSADGAAGTQSLDGFRVGNNQPLTGASNFMARGFYISDGGLTDAQALTHELYTKSKFGPFLTSDKYQRAVYATALDIWDAEDLSTGDGATVSVNWVGQQSGLALVPTGTPTMRTTLGPTGGKCVEFNGSDRFDLSSIGMWVKETAGFTVLVEASFDNVAGDIFLVDSQAATVNDGRIAILADSTNPIAVQAFSGVDITGTTNPRAAGWFAFTATHPGGPSQLARLYVDRSEEASDSRTMVPITGLKVGARHDNTLHYNGKISWIGVWSRALSAVEIGEVGDIRGWW